MNRVISFAAGLLIGIAVVFAIVFVYFAFGIAPVAVTAPDMPFEKTLARRALHARMESEVAAVGQPPMQPTEATLLAGARVYGEQCAVCHGVPGAEKSAIAAGMYPRPPQLFHGKGVTDDPPAETFWRVKNGTRMTGMPGYAGTLTAEQMWQVSLLLAKANQLPAAVTTALTTPAAAAPPAAPAAPAPAPAGP